MEKSPHIRTCPSCAKKFVLKNITQEKRYGWGKFCSRKCSKYNFNENYFSNIDSEEKAYWLGFLFADGNIYKNQMTLKLKQTEISHLEKFKLALNSDHTIHNGKNYISNKSKYKNVGYYSALLISNMQFTKDLISLGCVPNKSLIVEFPSISYDLSRHFIRGVFDGDGCISFIKNNSKYKRFNIISGSEKFINSIKFILEKEINASIHLRKLKGKNIFSLDTSKKNIVQSIFRFMYKDATIYLDRKYQKFL